MTEKPDMTMQEIEEDIIKDFNDLGDTISQYTFLITCAKECLPLPEAYRTEEYLVKDCQVNTWMYAGTKEGKTFFLADSESLIVKGGLALLQEIYQDRSETEVREYQCHLLDHEVFSKHFSATQLKGFQAIVKKAGNI